MCGLLALFGAWFAAPASAQAQAINGCLDTQYLDRTATGADRQLAWDFSISSDPERCMQVRVGQTVTWSGDLGVHPLGGSGGDSPNPIGLHQNGSVTFNTVGSFGFVCLSHSSMKGAIKVVAAATPTAAPAVSPWLAAALLLLLLATGMLAARAQSTMAAMRSQDQ